MADFVTAAALIFCILATATHLVTAALALSRVLASRTRERGLSVEPVSIVRPVCGLDHFDEMTLRSTFELNDSGYEIIFCAAREDDPAVPFVRNLIAEHPHIEARLLIGDDRPTSNPKLNNIVKGWAAARFPWIVLADNNVLMPAHYPLPQLRAGRWPRLLATRGQPSDRILGRTRMRVPQYLSGSLAKRRRHHRLRLCAGQIDAVAPRHSR